MLTHDLRTIAVCLLLSASATAADWPQWRGPNRNAVSNETGLLKSWHEAPPALEWRATGAGDGYSSVVIENGLLFTTGRVDSVVLCSCFDAKSGEKRWSAPVGSTSRNVMSTPTVHAGLVYTLDPDGELYCLNVADGSVVWKRDFVEDFNGRSSGRGYGESPLIDGDRLVCTPGGPEAMIVALDRRTGDVIWKASLPTNDSKSADTAAFSSIVISEGGGIRQYVQLTSRGLAGFETQTGRFLWRYDDISNGRINIPTPVARGDLIFSANGYHAGCVLLRLDATDDGAGITPHEVYRLQGNRFQNHHGGYVVIGDHVYGGHGSNNGLPTCLDLLTGRIAWKRRGPGSGSASVVAADGHVYFRYQNGIVAIIEAAPDEFLLKGTFELPGTGGDSWSHPVISDGRLFLREKDDLWVFNLKRGRTSPLPGRPVASGNGQRILQYRHAPGMPASSSLKTVAIQPSEILPDGSISADTLRRLQQADSPLLVSVAGSTVSRAGLRQLSSLKSLAVLNIAFCSRIGDDDLKELKHAVQLQAVIAAGTSITEAGVKHLASIPSLRALDLEYCDGVTDAACEVIADMDNLQALNVSKTGFEPTRITDTGLSRLSGLTKLQMLNLTGNSVTDTGLKHLSSLQQLRDLNLSRVAITDAGLMHLARVNGLRRLVLLFSEGFAGPIVTDSGVASLKTLEHLTELNLVDSRTTDASIDDLAEYPSLTVLTLTGSRISTEGLARLRSARPDCKVIAGATSK